MIAKREMMAAAKRLATKTHNLEIAADLQAIMNGVNEVLMEHDIKDLQLKLVKACHGEKG